MKLRASRAKFDQAKNTLEAYISQNEDVLDMYEVLKEEYNEALKDLKATYKENYEKVGPKYGDFKARTRVVVDANLLLDMMGDSANDLVKVKYSVDRKAYDDALSNGDIPKKVVDTVESVSIAIYGPKEL